MVVVVAVGSDISVDFGAEEAGETLTILKERIYLVCHDV